MSRNYCSTGVLLLAIKQLTTGVASSARALPMSFVVIVAVPVESGTWMKFGW